jgi:hypothetical protein
MRARLLILLGVTAAWPACAAAAPVSGPHGTIDHQFTTKLPGKPTGSTFTGTYHAAGDPSGDPPYMRRMTFYPPKGMRYDTTVPERCTASDAELQLRGAAACPEGSRLGGGTGRGKFMDNETELRIDVFNNAGEQVMVTSSPLVATVGRGKFGPGGSITYETPTCFPAVGPGPCPVDSALQLGAAVTLKPYTRTSGGVTRSYLTTPPKCPRSGRWRGPVRFWWADGTGETIVTEQRCRRPAARKPRRRGGPKPRVHRR